MSTTTVNFQKNINPEFDNYSLSQLIIQYAAPEKKDKPMHSVEDLEKLLNEIISNRVFFEGTSRQRGEHEIFIKESINSNQEVSDLYPTRHHFSTQLEKVTTVINYLGDEVFKEKNLMQRFQDKETVRVIRNMFNLVKEREHNKDNPLRKKRGQQEYAGTINTMAETKIDVDFLVYKHFDLEKRINYPLAFFIKYGKEGKSFAKKVGEYIADNIVDIHNKSKSNTVNIHSYDPGIALSYVLLKAKDKSKTVLKEKMVKDLFDLYEEDDNGEKRENEELEQIKKTTFQLTKLIEYKIIDELKKDSFDKELELLVNEGTIEMSTARENSITRNKNKNKYVREILQISSNIEKSLTSDTKEELLAKFYSQAGNLEDIRGIAVVKQNGISGTPHFEANKYFKPGSGEQHSESSNKGKRMYHAEHAKFYTRMLEKLSPRRWRKIKNKRLIEGHKEDVSGLILDLIGPDNRAKYGNTKQHSKYSHFTSEQKRMQSQITDRIGWLVVPVDAALKKLLITAKTDPTEDTYIRKLRECAKIVHEELYKT